MRSGCSFTLLNHYHLCVNFKNSNLWKRWRHTHAYYLFSL